MQRWEDLAKSLITALENANIRQYAQLLANRRRFFVLSFLGGMLRGLGAAIGFSVLGAVALMIISRVFGISFS